MEEEEAEASFDEDYVNDADPSVLRFLIASREEVSSKQVRLRPSVNPLPRIALGVRPRGHPRHPSPAWPHSACCDALLRLACQPGQQQSHRYVERYSCPC